MTPVSQANPPRWGSTVVNHGASLSAASGSCVTEITSGSPDRPSRMISTH